MSRDHLEKDFQLKFGRWARHRLTSTTAIELKVTATDSIAFDRLEVHQFAALKAAKHSKVFFKIPDSDFYTKKPFDCFLLTGTDAFVAVMFRNKDRGQKEFFLIDIDSWEQEATGPRKSLTEARARSVGRVERLA